MTSRPVGPPCLFHLASPTCEDDTVSFHGQVSNNNPAKKLPPTKFRKTDPGFFFLKQSLLSIGFTSDSHTGCLGQMRVTPELPQPAPDVTSAIKELFIIPWDKYINHLSISILLQRPGNEIRATWLNIHFIFRGSVSSTLPSCRSITWTNLPYT